MAEIVTTQSMIAIANFAILSQRAIASASAIIQSGVSAAAAKAQNGLNMKRLERETMNTPEWLEAIKQRKELAHRMVCDLASGKKKWRMCVPVAPDDTDITLCASLADIPALLQLVEKQREALEFYAEEENYCEEYLDNGGCGDPECCSPMYSKPKIEVDEGQKAREALAFKPEGVKA